MNKLCGLLLLFAFAANAQKTHTLSGYVEDLSTGERLIGVNIYVAGTSYGTSTNGYGFYSLTLPENNYEITASFIGYNPEKVQVELNKSNIHHNFLLAASTSQLNEVEVTAEELSVEKATMSTVTLSVPEIQKMPAFMGEVDIIRAIQLLPGVQSGTEGTTGFYVRGGSPDQNLILLDGVPVYNASHLFGFFSVFNSDAIKNVQLTKGGFPARYGGRLSSVLDISMKEGNMKEFHGAGSIGLISSRLTLEGPIIKDKTSFMISGRRTYHDLLIRPLLEKGFKVGYYFGDLNIKINHKISDKDRLYLSYYGGTDKFYSKEEQMYQSGNGYEKAKSSNHFMWGNRTGSLRWNHLFNDKLFSNFQATYTKYLYTVGYEHDEDDEYSFYEYSSLIEDYGLKTDFEYNLTSNHKLRFGASYTRHQFEPGAVQMKYEYDQEKMDSLTRLSNHVKSDDLYAYLEDSWTLTDRWKANVGLHYSAYFVNNVFYNSLQPRLSTRYLLSDSWSVKSSYAAMSQYVHLLSNTGIGLPTDLWVSATDNIKPQQSQQVALGTVKNFKSNTYEFSSEVYYKWMNNLIAYKPGASFLSNSDWQDNVEAGGKGWAYGLEVLLRKNKGKTTGWVGYTLAWTNRQFENLNEGKIYPYKYDRRHDLSIVVNHKFNEKIDAGLTWVYNTGNAFTAPEAFYTTPYNNYYGELEVFRYTSRNELRLPAYHRLDVGINFHKKKKWGERIWNISFYNAYNRRNPMFIYTKFSDGNGTEFMQASLFPIIPSFSYIFKF